MELLEENVDYNLDKIMEEEEENIDNYNLVNKSKKVEEN